jgi:4-diphosphocytidyl-2-C-methyl-D-erythritol kinase
VTANRRAWGWHSIYPAPAKLNLFLHVIGRRADGYHLLQTVFRFLGHGDRLRFSPRADGLIHLTTPLPGVVAEQDLTVRAARLLQTGDGVPGGVSISASKSVCHSAAASVAAVPMRQPYCWHSNHLWQVHLPRWRLQEMGLALGADVPVFIFGHSAFAEGVGEKLQAVELPPRWYVVLEPPLQVPTAAIFGAPELKRDSLPIEPQAWRPGVGGNDLEAVACARFPSIARHIACLSSLAPSPARMSGSGACVFAEFAGREEAGAALRQLPEGMRGWGDGGSGSTSAARTGGLTGQA